jgi:hypothetical protein
MVSVLITVFTGCAVAGALVVTLLQMATVEVHNAVQPTSEIQP